MPRRPPREYSPKLEGLETKQLLSGVKPAAYFPTDSSQSFFFGSAPTRPIVQISLDRVTNVKGRNALFDPPFGHVMVQANAPVPGKVYNVLFLSVYNATAQTFTAADNIRVRLSNDKRGVSYPILSGSDVWAPGGRIVFYVLSKQYYPISPTQSAGFQFNFVTPKATAIPGPSGIGLRIRYNPATFIKTLDHYVTSGPGAIGHQFGLPDTAIFQILKNRARQSLIHF